MNPTPPPPEKQEPDKDPDQTKRVAATLVGCFCTLVTAALLLAFVWFLLTALNPGHL